MIRIRSKYTGLAAVVAAALSLSACFGTDSEETASAIKLTETNLDSSAITIGATKATSIRGLIASDVGGITVTYTVLDNNQSPVDEDFTISTTAPGASETSWSLGDPKKGNSTIKANSTLMASDTGTYYLKIVVKNSAGTVDSTRFAFKVKATSTTVVGTPLVASVSGLAVGGSKAAAGSFVSIGDDTVYNQTASMTKFASIDLFATTNAAGQATLKSTAAAVAAADAGDSVGTLISDYWGNGRVTLITEVVSAPTTLEQAKTTIASISAQEALINTTNSTSYYVIKTQDNVYALLTVTNVSGTGANITFTLSIMK